MSENTSSLPILLNNKLVKNFLFLMLRLVRSHKDFSEEFLLLLFQNQLSVHYKKWKNKKSFASNFGKSSFLVDHLKRPSIACQKILCRSSGNTTTFSRVNLR